ncbi:hypothetical protein BJI67_16355 (plasmid) [Acidihalobacter aeolianus]|uniref:cyclic-guanylate-specific phosphodiesterase n=2 Tax=Acidihalobacter aeolianus TaxID=2792603 RepID=A0A1D8KCY0_9GAMM|nr:hypothetical protein BJI67_16355 [Acidihalobacter aeolianus]
MAGIDGILIYALIHHLMISRRAVHRTLHTLFAVVCLFALLLSLSHMLTVQSLTAAGYLERLKFEHIFALLLVYTLAVFTLYYAKRLAHWFVVAFGAAFAALIVIEMVLPYTLQFRQFYGIARETLPWGEVITIARGQPGYFAAIPTAVVLSSLGYAFVQLLRSYRETREPGRLWMLGAFGFVILGTAEIILVRLGLVHGVLLGSYDILGLVVVMSSVYILESQQQLATAESNFRELFERSPTAMVSFEPSSGRILEANTAAVNLTGFTREDFLARKVTEFGIQGDEDENGTFVQLIQRLASGEDVTASYESRLKRRDGRELLLDLYFSTIINPLGHVVRIIANAIDVTEARRAHQALALESEKNQMLLRSSSDGIHIVDAQGFLVEASDSFFDMLGYERGELNGCHVTEWDSEMTLSEIRAHLAGFFQANQYTVFETRHRRKNGAIIPVEIAAVPILLAGKPYIFNASRDITQRKRIREALQASETQFRTLFDTSPIGIAFCRDGALVEANTAFKVLHGYAGEENLIGRRFASFFVDDGQRLEEQYRRYESSAMGESFSSEAVARKKNGTEFPVLVSLQRVHMADGETTFAYMIDFTELKQREEEIQELAFYDQLTKLPNRHLMIDRLTLALSNAERSKHYGAVLMIDLDNFKVINDTLGHDYGDLVLQQVAVQLQNCLRPGDTLSRLGGDEFLVILESLADVEGAAVRETESTCQRLLHALGQPFMLDGKPYRISACIGATLFNNADLTLDDRIKQADIAMYQAKNTARNTMQFFDPRMQESINRRATDESDLYTAIENGQFELHYQIQVDGDGTPTGAEALIRWRHPERGLVSPAEFIPLAEETGQILPIGRWVINAACAQLRLWQSDPLMRHLTLSFNISSRQFQQPEFPRIVRRALQRHAAPADHLKIELTESVLLDNAEHAIAVMQQLRELGIRFSLDDFGTGYSSLQYLKRLPLDQLKIDQSFIHDISTDSGDLSIVQAIMAMASKLGFEVIAEGVETHEQRELLASIGCFAYQGYLFGRPVSATALLGTTEAVARAAVGR